MFQSGDQNWDSEFKMQKISQIENVTGTLKVSSEKIIGRKTKSLTCLRTYICIQYLLPAMDRVKP